MILLVKYPTRQRWTRFCANIADFHAKANKPEHINYQVTVDSDDQPPPGVLKELSQLANCGCNIRMSTCSPRGKVHAINDGVPNHGWDTLVLVSDDMTPKLHGWDDIIRVDMIAQKSDRVLLNYNADPRLGERWRGLVTLPIMTRSLYDHFGYVYNPIYQSEYCDNEQTEVCDMLGVLRHVDAQPVVHEWAQYYDSLSAKNVVAGRTDKITYERRKQSNFRD